MYVDYLGPAQLVMPILFLYNTLLTTVLVVQRFHLNKYRFAHKLALLSLVIPCSFFGQFFLPLLPGLDYSIWFLAYSVTISLLATIKYVNYVKGKGKTT